MGYSSNIQITMVLDLKQTKGTFLSTSSDGPGEIMHSK